MKVYIGSDHRGFEFKQVLHTWLLKNHYESKDMGNVELVSTDDYVDYATAVANAVAEDINKGLDSKGIVICGSGFGVDFTANKVKGIRSGVGFDEAQVKHGRTNDDINVLALASMFTDIERAKQLVKVFLETPFSNEERHKRRIGKIKEIEEIKD